MNILIMAQTYAPEEVSGAVLVTELSRDLAAANHHVTVVTCAPNYPYGRVYSGYANRGCQFEWLNGVRIIRTWTYISPKKTFWRRILSYATHTATSIYGSFAGGKPDVILCFIPPLPLGLSAWLLCSFWRIPWLLQIEDIYPDAAVAAGVLTNRTAIKFFSKMERFIYRKATKISVISKTFLENLISKGTSAEKLSVIPVWADPNMVFPYPKENFFRARYGLKEKFVIMYAGNHGLTSCLEHLVSAAERLRSDPDVVFVFIGEGVKKRELLVRSQELNLRNTLFLPYQPREIFCEMMAAADLHVVTLNHESSLSSLPSKTFNIMASARPVLAIGPRESELCQIIEEADCGLTVPVENIEKLVDAMLPLKADEARLERWGQNGRATLERKYSRSRCTGMIEKLLLSLHVE